MTVFCVRATCKALQGIQRGDPLLGGRITANEHCSGSHGGKGNSAAKAKFGGVVERVQSLLLAHVGASGRESSPH